MRPEALERLRGELRELERLGAGPWIAGREQDRGAVPEAIVAAEDVLLRAVPAATDAAERADLVKLAEAQLEIAAARRPGSAATADEAYNELADHHRRIAELLIKLERAEQVAGEPQSLQEASAVPGLIMDLLLTAGKTKDVQLAEAVKHRLGTSPLPWFGGLPAQVSAAPPACAAIGMELLPYQLTGMLVSDHGRPLDCRELTLKDMGNLSVLPDKVKWACDCGSIGCLETTSGIYGILEAIEEYTSECPGDLDTAVKLAEGSDSGSAEEPFRQAGEANAKGIGILVNFARTDYIVLYAPDAMTDTSYVAARAFRSAVEDFRSCCHNSAFGDCQLIIQPLRPYDGAHGAALLALERRFGVTADTALTDVELSL